MAIAPQKERPPQPVRWSRAQYHQMGDLGWFEGMRVELIEGEIVEMSPIGRRHWSAVNLVATLLSRVFGEGHFVSVQNALYLRESEPEADVAILKGDVRDYESADTIPVLVVEVADSSLVYDRNAKQRVYARNGILEFWIVNLPEEVLEVYREPNPDQGAYGSAVVLRGGDSVTPLSAPGAEITVADLLP